MNDGPLKYLSLFSGIEAASVAWRRLGWRPMAFAEIEPFPCQVLAHYWPEVPNLGDVTKADFVDRAKEVLDGATLDVLVFGSPCQGFSVAGKRLGLDDARSNLALRSIEILDGLKPRWFIFENVPGLFSSWSGGPEGIGDMDLAGGGTAEREFEESADFAAFLQAVHELGYLGAWSVLDAQYFRVAQRRERVFFVGHIGDWRGPAAVLFEPQSVSGDHPPRREKRERVAVGVEGGAGEGGGTFQNTGHGWWNESETATTLRTPDGGAALRQTSWPAEVAPPLNTTWADRSAGSQAQEFDSEGGGRFVPGCRM